MGRHVVMFYHIRAILTPTQQTVILLAHVVHTGRSAGECNCLSTPVSAGVHGVQQWGAHPGAVWAE